MTESLRIFVAPSNLADIPFKVLEKAIGSHYNCEPRHNIFSKTFQEDILVSGKQKLDI